MTLSEKIAGVADQSAIESLIKQGEYAKSEQDVEKLIATLRDLEAAYEDAILAYSTVVREEERLTERGVVFSSKKAEVDVLIVEGAYDKAVRKSVALIKEYLKRESAWLKAQEIVVILGSEVERVTEKGIVIPESFDIASVGVLMYEGEYTKAGRRAKSLIHKIRALENTFNDASGLFALLLRERNRLNEKGVPLPETTDPTTVEALLGAGDYNNAGVCAQEILDLLKALEAAYDRAMQMADLLGSEISRVNEKGVVLPPGISLDPVLDAIRAGDFDGAVDAASNLIRQIREIEADYDRAVDLAGRVRDGSERLKGLGVLIPFDLSEIDDLITAGRYDEAIARALEMLKSLDDLEAERLLNERSIKAFQDELDREIVRLKDRGIIIPYTTDTLASLIDAEEDEKAWEEAGNLLSGLRDLENLFDAAKRAQDRLVAETKRIKADGIVVPDYTGEVAKQMAAGDYRKAWETAGDRLLLILLIEGDVLDARAALAQLRAEIARLKKKGVVIADESDRVAALIVKGKVAAAKESAASQLQQNLMTEGRYDAAAAALKALSKEISRLQKKGVLVPDNRAAVEALISDGKYVPAQERVRTEILLLLSFESVYDGALEALAALKQEIARLTKKGVVVPDRTRVVNDLIVAGNYHEARSSAYDEIVVLRTIEQEYDTFTRSMEIFSTETDRLLTMGVKITDERPPVLKMAEDGRYREAIFRIDEVLTSYKAIEFEFESAQDALALLNKEITRLKKKGVVVMIVPAPVESLIAGGEYRNAHEEANLLISDLRATESLFDSAIEALSLLTKEIARLKKKGVVILGDTHEVRKFIEKGEYHTARSTAEVTISELRRTESDYNAAIEALKGLKKEMARIENRGIIMAETTDPVTVLIEKGAYSASRSEVSAIIQRLKKVEIAYESALEALSSLEQEIARIRNMGVLLSVTTEDVTALLESGAYNEAVSTAEKVHKQVRNIEIEYTAAIDALGDLVAEIDRLQGKGVIIDDDITAIHLEIEKGSYVQARTIAEEHLSIVRAAEIEYDSALATLADLKTEIKRLKTKGVLIDGDTNPVEKLIKSGEYRKAKEQADSHLSALKKTEREYDSAIGALEQVQTEIQRLVKKGVVITEDAAAIKIQIKDGAYKKAITVADKMQGRLRERESDYDAAVGSLKSYLREQGRVAENGVPVPEESTSIRTYIKTGEYAQARSEAEALVSHVKSFEWEYELTISAYESLKTEVERLKAQGIVITDDPGQVEEFIESDQYQHAKSISEGLLSKIKTTEWEYGLAKKALEALEREIVSGKNRKKGAKVDTEGIKATIREGRYRKAKSMAEELISTLRA